MDVDNKLEKRKSNEEECPFGAICPFTEPIKDKCPTCIRLFPIWKEESLTKKHFQ